MAQLSQCGKPKALYGLSISTLALAFLISKGSSSSGYQPLVGPVIGKSIEEGTTPEQETGVYKPFRLPPPYF
ncbi:hypothetical protein CROQUDRAFT_95850 [Cronartium quercuum f. sp. fusiforme G11]|uniref:Uncharacterized protein n=1 Tax=Cronartium quercuum f. sp. fusiforme G11 TaxID=708437 RepID=A0A9P6T9P1_9BASI|nr:hypothetical protein CROQUDRAFT_95850 [Cronartium quercuum f. sp. fusiforme G11]